MDGITNKLLKDAGMFVNSVILIASVLPKGLTDTSSKLQNHLTIT